VRQNSTYSSTVRAVMSQCPSFFEVGSIQALKDDNEIHTYEWGIQDTQSKYTEVCEVSLTKNLRGKTNRTWKSLGKS
jgi:hypothetical protein